MTVHFDPATHTYSNHWGDVYTSATQLVSRFKEPFDSVRIATNYARKHGETPEYWMQKWGQIRDTACDRGTAFHAQKEHMILSAQAHALFGQLHPVRAVAVDRLNQLPDGIHVELLLWDHDARLAGTADLVAIETDPASGIRYFDLDDHKTNKKIERESYYARRTGYRMMLPPLAHLMDCNFQHYELQLSVYSFMLARAGFRPRRAQFTHYPPAEGLSDAAGAAGGDGRVRAVGFGKPQCYPVRFLRAEVEMMVVV